MKLSIPNGVTRVVARQILLGQKHSPTILFAAGVVGVVATTVTACKATLKLEAVLEDAQNDRDDAKRVLEDPKHNYTESDYKKDMAYLYVRHTVEVIKLYGPSIILGSLSIAALTGSHRILSSRNAALTAAYAAVDKAFKEYRERVVSDLGEDKDREYRYGSEINTITVEDTNGPKKSKVKTHAGGASMYSRLFTEDNQNWCPQPEYNVAFLRAQQNWANDRLRARGHLMLNDVYDSLGLNQTPAGTQVGWLWQKGTGDNYVDFGIWSDKSMSRFIEFATGRENEILLDFNVDGVIWDKI